MEQTLLQKIQHLEMKILLEFDRVCTKHTINYSLFGGTLLGAVREKKTIPWDDDIDVCMLRSEYNKFLTHVNEINDSFIFQTHKCEKHYFGCPKLRLKDTILVEKDLKGKKISHGVWIDIMVLDFAPNCIDEYNNIINKRNKYDHILCSKYFSQSSFRDILRKILSNVMHPFPCSYYNNKIEKLYLESSRKNDNSNYLFYRWSADRKFNFSLFLQYERLDFNDHKLLSIKRKEDFLISIYGDNYMELPPIEERKSTHTIVECNL